MGSISRKLNAVLIMALAALLALGVISAFAESGPADPPGDVAAADDGDVDGDTDADVDGDADGDTDGDVDGDTDADVDGDADGDAQTQSHVNGDGNDGPNPDRGCANGSLDHTRSVLDGLLNRDHPGENEGILNALEKMCHGAAASVVSVGGDVSDGETHPGNGHAFGRGHGQGKPEGVPTNGGEE